VFDACSGIKKCLSEVFWKMMKKGILYFVFAVFLFSLCRSEAVDCTTITDQGLCNAETGCVFWWSANGGDDKCRPKCENYGTQATCVDPFNATFCVFDTQMSNCQRNCSTYGAFMNDACNNDIRCEWEGWPQNGGDDVCHDQCSYLTPLGKQGCSDWDVGDNFCVWDGSSCYRSCDEYVVPDECLSDSLHCTWNDPLFKCFSKCGNGVIDSPPEQCEADGDCAQGQKCSGCVCTKGQQSEAVPEFGTAAVISLIAIIAIAAVLTFKKK
jgi:hypothetical protein